MPQGDRIRRFGAAGSALALAFALCVIAAPLWTAPGADAKGARGSGPDFAVFTVQASKGFEVTIFTSRFSEGLQDIAVFASSARSTAIYRVSGVVSARTVEAEIGSLGRVAVRAVPAGGKPVVLRSCNGEPARKLTRLAYVGTIEFHGEEGFTDVEATRAPFDYRRFREFACGGEGGQSPDRARDGVRLDVHRPEEANELFLHATRLRPGGATEVSVQVDDYDSELETTRATALIAGPDALRFDPDLSHALLAPPAPFSGHASFRRHAQSSRRWTGNLTVDLPGDADYPLVGPGLQVSLARP